MFAQLIEAVRLEAKKPSEKKVTKLHRALRAHPDPLYHQSSRVAARGDAAVAKDRGHPDRKHYDTVMRDVRRGPK